MWQLRSVKHILLHNPKKIKKNGSSLILNIHDYLGICKIFCTTGNKKFYRYPCNSIIKELYKKSLQNKSIIFKQKHQTLFKGKKIKTSD